MDCDSKRYRCMFSSSAFRFEVYFKPEKHKLKCRHKQEQYADGSSKNDENIRISYGRRLPRVVWIPINGILQKNGSHGPAV